MKIAHRRLRVPTLAAAVAAVGLGVALPTSAQDAAADGSETSLDLGQIQAMMAARGGGGGAGNTDDLPDMAKVVEGLSKAANEDGQLFEVYYQAEESAKRPAEIYAVLPPSLMGRDLLLATSINAGPMAGYQWSDYLVRFKRRGDKVVLEVPDLSVRGDGPVSASVERTYTPRFLAVLPVKAKGPGGSLVVDLTPLTMGGATGAPGLRGPADESLSRHPKVKAFPENVLIDAELVGRGGGSTAGMSYAFRELPGRQNPMTRYQPRPADERVGYFLTVSQDWGKPHDAKDTVDRYVNRWELEKLDPSLEMSPPKEPIVFYIERTVPIQWRRYVQAGVDEWNKAFEKIGIVGAIQVRQQTDTQYADIDPEDARYNFIRWIVTGRGFAMGPSRPDPRTGQILDADIIFDDSMLRYFQDNLDLLGPKAMAAELGPDRLAFWREHPEFRPMGVTAAEVDAALADAETAGPTFGAAGSNFAPTDPSADDARLRAATVIAELAGRETPATATAASKLSPDAGHCNYADGARRQMAVLHLAHLAALHPTTRPSTRPAADEAGEDQTVVEAMEDVAEEVAEAVGEIAGEAGGAEKMRLPEKYLGLVLQEVVAHEVGHTLGLRHNFKASSWLSLDEIKARRADAGKPTVSSVMDYNPVLLFAGDDLEGAETVITPTVGPYDEWAIEYGYSILPRRGWQQKLAQIADKAGREELAYATDEDTRGLISPDPTVNRYDMGDDPVAWAQSRVELADELMAGIEEWAVDAGDPNEVLRSAFLNLFFEKVSGTGFVARMVGGQRFSRSRFGDAVTTGDPAGLTPLSADEQRKAVAFLAETALADGFFDLDAELLNKLVPTRSPGVNGYPSSRIDFPVHDYVLRAQNRSLAVLCDPTVMDRVYDAQLKAAGDGEGDEPFTVGELIAGVSDAVWKPDALTQAADGGEFAAGEPLFDSLRRNLQTQHLNYLLAVAKSEPGRLVNADVRNQVRYHLRGLMTGLDAALENRGLDTASAAHLTESRSRIERVLEAPQIDAPAGGGSSITIIMGQDEQ